MATALVVVGLIQFLGKSGSARAWRLDAAPRPLTQQVNQPILWLQYGRTPSAGDLRRAATTARVVVLNASEVSALRELKRLNSRITVLAYKDLSSTRSYEGAVVGGKDATHLPTGVGYVAANTQHQDWFAVDSTGNRIQWNGYPGHWQMAVWKPAYRKAWTQSVVSEVVKNGWDGVLADNALSTLRYYFNGHLGDHANDQVLAKGIAQLVDEAGQALQTQGRLFVPNVGDGRLHPGLWPQLTRFGGGMEEQFLHFSARRTGDFLGDPESARGVDGSVTSASDWDRQATEVAGAGLALVHTQAAPDDNRSFLYGYASFLVAGGGFGAFSATPPDGYAALSLRPEQAWPVGVTSAPARRSGSLRYRWFPGLFVAVNASTDKSVVLTLPAGLSDGSGKVVVSVTLGPSSGAVLQRRVSAQREGLEPPVTVR